jgi:NAD(P)-dependent dehydrogenase (short-subunit alcohol dehydrogenase family)
LDTYLFNLDTYAFQNTFKFAKKKIMSKTIFITGASKGLGKATAKLFQARGWNVVATMRNPEQETELAQLENVLLLELDVTNEAQIKAVVDKAIAWKDIDVVFNNAGYGLMSALEAMTDEQLTRQLNTNVLGVMRVTKAFVPYFRKKQSGLFISTTSIGGFMGYPLHAIYNAAKFAIEGWSEAMYYELALHNIGIKTVAPGGIVTDFIGGSLDKATMPEYKQIEDQLFTTLETMVERGSSAEQIAEVVYEAATDGKDQIRYLAGEDAKAIYATRETQGVDEFRKGIRAQFNI